MAKSFKVSGPKKPPERPNFVLGSRPGTLRQNPVPRIKPLLEQRQYGKGDANPPNPAGASFGDTDSMNGMG